MSRFNLRGTRISDLNDLDRHHRYLIDKTPPWKCSPNILEEWRCLVDIIRKSLFVEETQWFFSYPYTIVKQERPDFKILFPNKKTPLLIEISEITTQRIKTTFSEASKRNDCCLIDWSAKMLRLGKPEKGEGKKNIREFGEDLGEEPLYGNAVEVQWAEATTDIICKKKEEEYADRTSILMLHDISFPLSYRQFLEKRFQILKETIDREPERFIFNAFPNIITNSHASLGIIRLKGNWICKLATLSADWVESLQSIISYKQC